MIISGNLDETSIVDAFQLIGSSRRTGILRASQKDGEIRTYWKNGSIVFAESGKAESGLHTRLSSIAGPERWHRVLREASGCLGVAASRLVSDGVLDEPRLEKLAEDSSRQAIEELFSWAEGGFEFTEGPFPDSDIVGVSLHTPSLIIEGSRRVQRLTQLRSTIPRQTVFRLAALPEASLTSIKLSSEEWAMLSQVNGHRTVEEILRQSGGDEIRSLQALYGLLSTGLIVELEPVDDDDSGKLELGRVKYSRILEVYCELHTMLMDRLHETPQDILVPPLAAACAKLAKAYPKVWAGIPHRPERELPGAQFLANILKIPAEQRTPLMMQSFGHLLLKEILVIRHVLGDDAARAAIRDVRMVLQLGPKRYPEVSSKILRHLRDVLRQAEQIPSRYKMGFDFFETHRYEEAIRLWRSIPQTNPQYAAVQELIAQARRLTAGRSRLRLALERGEHLYAEGRYQEAVEVWHEAIDREPEANDPEHEPTKTTLVKRLDEMSRVSVLLGEARARSQDRRYDEARRLLEEALSITPDLPEASELLRDIAERADKMTTLRELVFQGLEQYRAERYPEAIEVFRRVLSIDPRHQLAGDHLRFSQERLAALVESRPRYAPALAASRAGDHFRSMDLWEHLLQQEPGDRIAVFYIREERGALQAQRIFHEAMTFFLDRNFGRAVELLERLLVERPTHAEARRLLDECRIQMAQMDQTQGLLRQAERHYASGQYPEANQALERILELDPQHRSARLAQAQLQQALEEERTTGTFRATGSLVAHLTEEQPTSTVRVIPEHAPAQLFDDLLAEETTPMDPHPAGRLHGSSRQQAASEDEEPPTPDMRDLAEEVQRRLQQDEDTRPFPPLKS